MPRLLPCASLCLGVLATLAVLVGFSRPALASAYGLSDIDLVDEAMAGRMAAMQIQTTLDLFNATKTPKGVAAVSKKLKVSAAKVQDWRDFCDLLRIDGIGPKLARVLSLCGIKRLSLLSAAQPAALADRIKEVNASAEILGKLPGEENVRSWIEQAKKLGSR